MSFTKDDVKVGGRYPPPGKARKFVKRLAVRKRRASDKRAVRAGSHPVAAGLPENP